MALQVAKQLSYIPGKTRKTWIWKTALKKSAIYVFQSECKIFVSLFHCFTCFTCFTWNMKQWNSTFRFSSETVKQWNSYRKKEWNSETVSLFHQNCFYFLKHGKMVLEQIVGANLLFFQPIFQKNREFRKQNKLYSRF